MSYPLNAEQYPFFFYGTMRHSQENYVVLRGRTVFEQLARAYGMTLFSMRSYPAMVPGDRVVQGELMILHPRFYYDLLLELDRAEGYNPDKHDACLFQRTLITVELESGAEVLAWCYMGNSELVKRLTLEEVPGGDWEQYQLHHMMETRFRRYLGASKQAHFARPSDNGGVRKKEQPEAMPQSSIFRWREGSGWLVLTGGGDFRDSDNTDILAQVLSRTLSQGPLAYVWAAGDVEEADKHLDYLAELGGRTGYLVDVLEEDDETVIQLLSQAGIVLIGDGPDAEKLRSSLTGPGMAGIRQAYAQEATIVGLGAGAMVLGHAILGGGEMQRGFNWLEQALVLPGYDESQAEVLHGFLRDHPDTYGLGLSKGSAVAFLPTGAVEVWGNKRIIVSLGKAMTRSGSGD
jgi:gamma-glutamylcyclotransferase (GGCT)/AIG2-like uncharacterized protein YtfP